MKKPHQFLEKVLHIELLEYQKKFVDTVLSKNNTGVYPVLSRGSSRMFHSSENRLYEDLKGLEENKNDK